MSVVLLHDDGPGAGLGHRRRMEALAAALRALGRTCEVRPVAPLATGVVAVIDSYRFRADDREMFRAAAIAAVDDLERDLDVDLLIDPNDAARPAGRAGRLLAGSRYAIVDPSLSERVTPVHAASATVLVTGGAAGVELAVRVSAEILALSPGTCVRVVLPPGGEVEPPAGVFAVTAPDGLGSELAAADMVVTAGGVTMLESLALARPTIAIVTAGNQRRAVSHAAAAGAVVEADERSAARIAAELLRDQETREALRAAARRHVDGDGARRVAEEIDRLA